MTQSPASESGPVRYGAYFRSGTVRIGDHDIRDISLESLHDAVGVVTQEAHLFHDTIRANLLYACPGATEEDLVAVCKAVGSGT
jgi:ATP-binding cassette, subfamily B, bacterial